MEVLANTKKKEKPILAENIVSRRKALGFREALAFAEAAKVPYATLRDIEAGISEGRPETRAKIAAALKWEFWQLYAPASKKKAQTKPQLNPDQPGDRDVLIGKIVATFPALNQDQLDRVLGFIETALEDAPGSASSSDSVKFTK